ncbi:hypothetical protein HDU76_007928, partial [Blyttiomyces sp. JEL0837]
MLNPVFRLQNIALLAPVFSDTASELCKSWNELFESSKEEEIEIDIGADMSKVTLDVIGKAGFGFDFHAIDGNASELSKTFTSILSNFAITPMLIIELLFPLITYLPIERFRQRRKDKKMTDALVDEIIMKRKADVSNGCVKESKDLLSILIKDNMESHQSEQLSHDELVSQVFTFIVAGHETTSTALTWALHVLSTHPDIQQRLCDEMAACGNDRPSFELINSNLPYLDAFAKETLRYYPPVLSLRRIASKEDVIDGVTIPKGTTIIVSPSITHRSEQYWGPDADEFSPDRWLSDHHPSHNGDTERPKFEGDHPVTMEGAPRAFGAYLPFSLGP